MEGRHKDTCVGDKWSLFVIGTLQDGLITRTAYAEVPPRVEFALTRLGASLLEIVHSLTSGHRAVLRASTEMA